MKRPASTLVAALLFATSADAHAPPEATGVLWMQTAGHERNVIRTNRGLIVTEDGGATFRLLCNDAFQASLTEIAPVVVTSAGRLLLASYLGGLVESTDDLCGYSSVPGPLSKGTNVVALAASPSAPASIYAAMSRDGSDDHLVASADDGVTWHAPSHVQDFVFTVRVAPSDARRLYASSLYDGDGGAQVYRLLVSSDAGVTFRVHAVPLIDPEIGLSVLAVDPSSPERAFLRTAASDPTLNERLLYTDDGGDTTVDALTLRGPSSVAMTADGSTTWVGGQDGMFVSVDHGKTFKMLAGAGVSEIACLEFHAGKLYACGLSQNTYGVLVSSDLGQTFSFYLRFPQVTAPLDCPATSSAGLACAARFEDWRVEQGLPGSSGGAEASAGSGALPSQMGGASNGGVLSSGGARNGIAGAGGSGAAPARSSTGCDVSSSTGRGISLLALAAGVIAFLFAERRCGRR